MTFATSSRTALALTVSCLALLTASPTRAATPADQAAPTAAASAPGDVPLTTLKDKTSYATGVMTARNLTRNQVDFDLGLLVQGLRDGMAGGQIRLSEKEIKDVLQSMQADMQRHLAAERQVKAGVNSERGLAFQNEFRSKPGVTVLPGNLMYRVIKAGQGDRPGESGTVVVKYRGTLVDGSEFDATPEGKTATLRLGEVITGWREALKRMPAGSIWEVVVPSSMAYSTRGTPDIGPNETLIFTLELVAVVNN
jgi:FKBP-type peptidyl-prolyl cis-trans isomerase FklB